MMLLIQSSALRRDKVSEAIHITFDRRRTHELPTALPQPPTDWDQSYDALATECGLPRGASAAVVVLEKFLNEVGIYKAKSIKS